jgi:hypothetical protein
MSYTNLNNPANYQLQSFGQEGMRTISTTQAYVEGEYYRVLVATEDSTLSATSMVGDDLASIDVYAGTTIYGLFTAVTVTAGEVTAYLAGRTDIDDVWAYIRAYGEANGVTIEGEDCAKAAISPLLDKYYAKASLVMVPSLYKTSIVYSERPLSTDGQLTFSRSTAATRVASNGLIERVRTNLALQSQTFDNASWVKAFATITANATTAPDGTLTADKLIANIGYDPVSATGNLRQTNIVATNTHTISLYAKAAEFTSIRFRENFIVGAFLTIDLTNGSITGAGSQYINPTATAVGDGWYRISFVTPATADLDKYSIRVANTGDGTSGVFIWGFQYEVSDFGPTDYIATTAAAVSVGPVANVPRLDYLGSSCPRLLLEPQRQNLALFSESFNNAAWSKVNATITANDAVSPDGYTNADKLVSTGGASRVERFPTLADNTDYTASIFAKKGSVNFVAISFLKKNNVQDRVFFNLLDGSIGTTEGSPISKSIQEYGDYYRVTITSNSSSGATSPRIQYLIGAIDNNVVTTSGDFIYIYGAQFEAGAYPTSYIPTLGAAVTRGADLASKTGISSLIGQTEGTLFVEFDNSTTAQGTTRRIITISDGTGNNRIGVSINTSNIMDCFVTLSGIGQAIIGFGATSLQRYKIALAYASNDIAFYVNGVQIGIDTSATIPACTQIHLGRETGTNDLPLGSGYNQALLFKTRLTNAQLAELTTL